MLSFVISPIEYLAFLLFIGITIIGTCVFVAKHEKKPINIILWCLLSIFIPILGSVIYFSYYFLNKDRVDAVYPKR